MVLDGSKEASLPSCGDNLHWCSYTVTIRVRLVCIKACHWVQVDMMQIMHSSFLAFDNFYSTSTPAFFYGFTLYIHCQFAFAWRKKCYDMILKFRYFI